MGIVDASDPCQATTLAGGQPNASSPCPSVEQMMGIVDASDPCQATTLAGGQPNPSAIPSSTFTNLGTALQSLVSSFTGATPTAGAPCFQIAFPWIGSSQGGVCVPSVAVPSPWGTVITAGVVAFLLMGLLRKK
jgi:hypothetical protein